MMSAMSSPGARVLVVDDDEPLLEVIAAILEPLGFAVATLSRGADALARLASESFDLVISDLVMPGVDGHDLIGVLRARGDDTPVLYLSGTGTVPDVVKVMKLGAVGFLQKPFEPAELKREVLAALDAHKRAAAPPTVIATPRMRSDPPVPPPKSPRGTKPPPLPAGARGTGSGLELAEIDLESYDSAATHDAEVTPSMLEPQRFGRYVIRSVLASGGMGRVYRAYDPNLAREVALKVLHAPLADSEQAQFGARFRREAVALAKLRHPHIVAVHDCGIDDGVAFVVMELVDGRSLASLLQAEGPLTLDRTMHIAGQLAEALAYAHKSGVVHRDVKPDNVVIEANDFVRLIDFGLACVEDSSLTLGAYVVGTPNYLSPEAASSRPIDHRADQFSLATVILEMLSGKRVFRGANLEGTVRNICIMPPPTLADLGIVAPAALQELLAQMHEKDPDERVQSEDELLQRLVALGA